MRATLSLVPVLFLGACGSFTSSADEKAADSFWENADLYYNGRDYARAADQVERGLEHDRRHYKLNLLKGALLLQRARVDQDYFKEALAQLERVRDLRNPDAQENAVWIGLGRAHQGIYQIHRRKAIELRKQAKSAAESQRGQLNAQADEHVGLFHDHLAEAERSFRLVADKKQRQSILAIEELCLIEVDKAWGLEGEARLAQLRRAAKQAEEYLQENTYRQKHYEVMVKITPRFEQEQTGRRLLEGYRDRERDFRASYANLLYKLDDFAGARTQLDRVLELDPTRAAEYYNRARCHVKLGNKKLAKEDLEHFLRMTKQSFDGHQVKEATRLLGELGG